MQIETLKHNGAALDENAKAVEAGLAMHLRVKSALDDAREIIAMQESKLKQAEVEIEALHGLNNLLESRMIAALAERDAAIAGRAVYESLFAMFQATMREFKVPAVPLILQTGVDYAEGKTA